MDTALFSPSSLFNDSDNEDGNSCNTEQRTHAFPGMELVIREFSFHELNANLLWPGTFAFAEWLVQNKSLLQGRRRILELGSGTGALAIFLQKSLGIDITTSDFDDEEVEENIAHNCTLNGLPVLPHIRHSWGDTFPTTEPDWDLVIASDILLYVKQYPNLIRTLSFLLKSYKQRDEKACPENFRDKKSVTLSGKDMGLPWPAFLMSWRRRIGKEEEMLFFSGCEDAGLRAEHLGSRVYCISPLQETNWAKQPMESGVKGLQVISPRISTKGHYARRKHQMGQMNASSSDLLGKAPYQHGHYLNEFREILKPRLL